MGDKFDKLVDEVGELDASVFATNFVQDAIDELNAHYRLGYIDGAAAAFGIIGMAEAIRASAPRLWPKVEIAACGACSSLRWEDGRASVGYVDPECLTHGWRSPRSTEA